MCAKVLNHILTYLIQGLGMSMVVSAWGASIVFGPATSGMYVAVIMCYVVICVVKFCRIVS